MRACATLLVAVWATLHAQNIPHLAYALPAGGQQGTTIQVTLGGQFLPNVSDVYISGRGVLATVGEHTRPMSGQEATTLRERMQELQKQTMDDASFRELADIRVKLLQFNARRLTSPVLAETLKLQIAIAPDAPPGKRELRVASPQGLSNPLVFYVGQLPEFTEEEKIEVERGAANLPRAQALNQIQIAQHPTDMRITLPATVNGRIKPGLPRPQGQARQGQPYTPGEADRYRFTARKGQELVVAVSARDLMPYLADAVPGWFQAVLTLYDSSGKEVAYCDDYRFHPDPVLHYTVPQDGEYSVEIKDAIYRGREDFVYRIAIGELPYVTGIFPMGGAAGGKTSVEATGWNLPLNKLTMDAKEKAAGVYPLYVPDGGLVSNAMPFQVDTLPEIVEKEPNDTPGVAQRVKLPVMVNGRIGKPGDWDVYSFEGRAGQAIVAEVYARRLESPLDSVLRLTDAKGTQLAFNDDCDDKGEGMETFHADSRIMTTLPSSGVYYLYLGDTEHNGGADYAYRLRISEPRPDFDLRISPAAIDINPGQTVPVTVTALRKDGYSGEIAISLKDAPAGFALAGAVIAAGRDDVRMTITAPPFFQAQPIALDMEGRATIQGHEVRHRAVPAENMMQAFFYWHLVPAAELKVAFRRGNPFRERIQMNGAQPLKLAAGGTARFQVRVPVPPNNQLEQLQYELNDPPAGITLKQVLTVGDATELVFACDAAKAEPGMKGNLIVDIWAQRKPQPDTPGRPAAAARQRVPLGTLPAIRFEVGGQGLHP
jgi:hypothetical protein